MNETNTRSEGSRLNVGPVQKKDLHSAHGVGVPQGSLWGARGKGDV